MRDAMNLLLTRLVITFIRGYQILLSPLLPKSCRFHPTCSCYAIEAIQLHGMKKGCFERNEADFAVEIGHIRRKI